MAIIAVGVLWDAGDCETIIAEGAADMVVLARELLEAASSWTERIPPVHVGRG